MSGYQHRDARARREREAREAAQALALRELGYAVEAVATAKRRRDAAARAALAAGNTQAQVGEVLGVTRQAVSKRHRPAAWGVVT